MDVNHNGVVFHDGITSIAGFDNFKNPVIQTSSIIDKDVKQILITKQLFSNDLHIKMKIYTDTYNIHWRQYDKNIFFTTDSYSDDFIWKATEVYLGNNDFIISKQLMWIYPYTKIEVEENLSVQVEKRRRVIENIFKEKIYKDILNSVLEYTGN